jgi:hypothetical protein
MISICWLLPQILVIKTTAPKTAAKLKKTSSSNSRARTSIPSPSPGGQAIFASRCNQIAVPPPFPSYISAPHISRHLSAANKHPRPSGSITRKSAILSSGPLPDECCSMNGHIRCNWRLKQESLKNGFGHGYAYL